MASAQVTITQLPAAGPLTGDELVPIVQNGQTVQTTTGDIAVQPTQTQTFLTVTQQTSLPNSRYLAVGSGLSSTDNGAQGTLQINLTGTAASLNSSGNGLIAKTATNTVTPREIEVGTGLTIADGDGVAANPLVGLGSFLSSIQSLSGSTGLVGVSGGAATARSVAGTSNQISVSNGDASSGNPTVGLANNPIVPGNGSITLPNGTTGQRVSNLGAFRYNTSLQQFEGYTNTGWNQFSLSGGVTSFSAGTTGFTPNVDTSGAVTLDGTLNVANGGTGANTLTGVAYGNGTSAFTAATGSQIAAAIGSTAVTNATNATNATTATNVAGGAANKVVFQSGSGTTSFVDAPIASSTFLQWTGSAFQWASIVGGLSYQGGWNASTNTPTLTSSVGTNGYYYVVTVAGNTNLNGITDWAVGDWAIFNGSTWQKIDQTNTVSSVNGYVGAVSLTYSDVGAPSTSGTNATGTWNIGISGNAATATSATSATSATTATNVAGGAANKIVYNTGSGATSFIDAPVTTGHYLKWNGSAFAWDVAGTGTVTSIDVSGGTTGLTTSGGPVTSSGTITLAGTLGAANGGTGVTTLSGLAYGNGTSAFTAATGSQIAAAIGSTAVTNATNATNVAISTSTTNADYNFTLVSTNTGNLPEYVVSGLTANPSTGKITGGIAGGTF